MHGQYIASYIYVNRLEEPEFSRFNLECIQELVNSHFKQQLKKYFCCVNYRSCW